MTKTEELEMLLKSVKDSYSDFVNGGLMEARDNNRYAEMVIEYIKSHPNASTSDVIKFETEEVFGIKPI